MKRKVSVILALALVLCMICSMFAFVACDEECTEHVDADGDGICDNCGETMPEEECTQHVDADGDGKCDNCGTAMPDDGGDECTEHVDSDGDGKCDNCGICMTHKDADSDGKCDNCGECISHRDANDDGKCDNCGESVIMSYYPDYAMNRIIDNLSAQYSELAGSYVFGVSFEAAIDAKKGAAQATQYVLRGKASIDLRANEADREDSAIWVELVEKTADGEEVVLGLALESTDGAPYLYANALNGGYKKINAVSIYDLAVLTGAAEPGSGALATAGTDDMITSVIYSLLFGDSVEYNVPDNDYEFTLSVANMMTELSDVLQLVDIGSLIGISESDIIAIVETVFGDLTYESGEETVEVDTLSDLLAWVSANYGGYGGIVTVDFAADNTYEGATAELVDGEDGNANVTLNEVNVGVDTVAVMDEFPLSEAQRSEMEAINLLNFKLEGRAEGRDAAGTAHNWYNIVVEADIDPFVFLDFINGTDIDTVKNVVKNLGYLRVTVDEVNAEGAHVSNILTLFADLDGSDNPILVNLNAYDIMSGIIKANLGGVYEVDEFIDMIADLAGGTGEGGDGSGEGSGSEGEGGDGSGEEGGGIDIVALIGDIFSAIDTENMTESGVTIDVNKLGDVICEALNINMEVMGMNIADIIKSDLLNGEQSPFLNISLSAPQYGACERTFGYRDVEAGYKNGLNGFFAEAEFASLPEIVEEGAEDMIGESVIDASGNMSIKGKDFNGNDLSASAYVLEERYTTVGDTIEVEYVVSVIADLPGNGILGSALGDSVNLKELPLSGVFTIKGSVQVRPYDEQAQIDVKVKVSYGEAPAIVDEVNTTYGLTSDAGVYATVATRSSNSIVVTITSGGNAKEYTFNKNSMKVYDAEGNDVTAEVYDAAADKITVAGKYTLGFEVGRYKIEVATASIDTFELRRADGGEAQTEIDIDGGLLYNDYKIIETTAEGETKELPIVAKAIDGGLAEEDFTDFVMTTKDLQDVGKKVNLEITVTSTNHGDVKITTPEVNVVSDKWVSVNNLLLGQSVNDVAVIHEGPVDYYTRYDAENGFSLVDAEGNAYATQTYQIRMYWEDAAGNADLTFNEAGQVTNIPVGTSASLGKYDAVFRIEFADGFYYQLTLDVSGLYAGTSARKLVAGEQFTLETIIGGTTGSAMYPNTLEKWYWYNADGNRAELEFKFVAGNEFAIVVAGTDTVVATFTLNILDAENESVELVNGAIAAAGSYTMTVEVEFLGQTYTLQRNASSGYQVTVSEA